MVINIDIDKAAALFFADRFRIYQQIGGKDTYSAYVGKFVSNMVDELIGELKNG